MKQFCFLLGCLLLVNPAHAITVFTADLTHDQEVARGPFLTGSGGSRPQSYGTAKFILNDEETELRMIATIFNIDVTGTQTTDTFDNLAAAHIHVGAGPGVNAGVRWGFFGAPDNDNNPDNLVVSAFASGVGGTFSSVWNLTEGNAGTTLTDNLPLIKAGLAYVNFHTVQFGGGEIRGQLTAVPDGGATAALFSLGIAGLALARRKLS